MPEALAADTGERYGVLTTLAAAHPQHAATVELLLGCGGPTDSPGEIVP